MRETPSAANRVSLIETTPMQETMWRVSWRTDRWIGACGTIYSRGPRT
jgi:hypothetical protein